MDLWEERARREVSAAQEKKPSVVRDELSPFLDTLISSLRLGRLEFDENKRIAVTHGQQRAGILNYTLAEMMKEYSLLRQVIIEVLRQSGPLSDNDQDIIHGSVDSAMLLAGNEFAQAEKAVIRQALEKAEQSNRDLDQFAAALAHDLRSPLGIITGFTQLMEDELYQHASPDLRQAMVYIRNAVDRMVALIDGILSYARLSSGTVEFDNVNSETAVAAAIQNLKSQLTETAGRVSYEALPQVRGNLPLLTQLFQNLIANALKFRSEAIPKIEISAKEQDETWLFSVKDNGVGFDPSQSEFIFKFSKRLQNQQGGAGIGLATCRRVVELHGGRIWAESEPGKGSTFCFTLPKDV